MLPLVANLARFLIKRWRQFCNIWPILSSKFHWFLVNYLKKYFRHATIHQSATILLNLKSDIVDGYLCFFFASCDQVCSSSELLSPPSLSASAASSSSWEHQGLGQVQLTKYSSIDASSTFPDLALQVQLQVQYTQHFKYFSLNHNSFHYAINNNKIFILAHHDIMIYNGTWYKILI